MSERPPHQRRGLGRGLSALMGDYVEPSPEELSRDVRHVPVAELEPNPYQPRRHFDQDRLRELSRSISDRGLLQPLVVRPVEAAGGPARFQIIAGERRWRAAQMAELHEVPVIVREMDDEEALSVAIVENIQRRDLSPVEEARGYRRLVDDFGHKQEEVSLVVKKSRSHVANLMRLLTLPASVQQRVDEGRLSMGHARALIGAVDPEALARQVEAKGLSVRKTEELAAQKKPSASAPPAPRKGAKDADTKALEADLSNALGLGVEIRHKGETGGAVTVRYKSLEQLDDLCQRLIHHG